MGWMNGSRDSLVVPGKLQWLQSRKVLFGWRFEDWGVASHLGERFKLQAQEKCFSRWKSHLTAENALCNIGAIPCSLTETLALKRINCLTGCCSLSLSLSLSHLLFCPLFVLPHHSFAFSPCSSLTILGLSSPSPLPLSSPSCLLCPLLRSWASPFHSASTLLVSSLPSFFLVKITRALVHPAVRRTQPFRNVTSFTINLPLCRPGERSPPPAPHYPCWKWWNWERRWVFKGHPIYQSIYNSVNICFYISFKIILQ